MKKILLLTGTILFLTAASVFADCGFCDKAESSKGSMMKEGWMEKKMEMMNTELDLSAEQSTQVQALMKEKMEKKKAVMAESEEKMQAIHDEYKSKLKAVLSEEQAVKYDAMQAKGSGAQHDHEHKGSGHEHDKGSKKEKKGSY